MTDLFEAATSTWYTMFFVCFLMFFCGMAWLLLFQWFQEQVYSLRKTDWYRAKYLGAVVCGHEWTQWTLTGRSGLSIDHEGDLAQFDDESLQKRSCTMCGLTQERPLYVTNSDY